MGSKKVFFDDNNNEMDCFISMEGNLHIAIGTAGQDTVYKGHINLKQNDVIELIRVLQELKDQVNMK
jgi:hypothetical protein